MLIARKACRHCAFSKHHLGTKERNREEIGWLESLGKVLQCHEYSKPTMCAGHCAKLGIKGKREEARGDLKHKYAYVTKEQKDAATLGGIK